MRTFATDIGRGSLPLGKGFENRGLLLGDVLMVSELLLFLEAVCEDRDVVLRPGSQWAVWIERAGCMRHDSCCQSLPGGALHQTRDMG